jgi:hypothetical protein
MRMLRICVTANSHWLTVRFNVFPCNLNIGMNFTDAYKLQSVRVLRVSYRVYWHLQQLLQLLLAAIHSVTS